MQGNPDSSIYTTPIITFLLTLGLTLGGSWLYMRDTVQANTLDNLKYHGLIDRHEIQLDGMQTVLIQLRENQMYSGTEREDFKRLLEQNVELMTQLQLTLSSQTAAVDVKLDNITQRLDKAGL